MTRSKVETALTLLEHEPSVLIEIGDDEDHNDISRQVPRGTRARGQDLTRRKYPTRASETPYWREGTGLENHTTVLVFYDPEVYVGGDLLGPAAARDDAVIVLEDGSISGTTSGAQMGIQSFVRRDSRRKE